MLFRSLVPSVVPPAFVSAAPELINGKKPKPVRTVLLPQLPEPMAPPRTVAVQVAPQPVPTEQPRTLPAVQPEVIARALPLPDETPIQMEPRTSPRRYETPAILPEPSALRRLAPAPESAAPRAALAEPALPGSVRPGVVDYLSPYPLAGGIDTVPLGDPALKDRELPEALALSRSRPGEGALDSSLADPQAKAEERPDTLSMALPPFSRAGEGEYSLADPAIIEQERAQAFARMAPSMLPGGRVPGLAWPELEADEIPDAVLARLVSPPMAVPATSLAEGEEIGRASCRERV